MIVYEYVDREGGVITSWELQKRERARLDAKIDMLRAVDFDTAQQMIRGVKNHRGVFKYQVTVQHVQLRPLLCYGPSKPRQELTFLVAAYERDWKWEPANAPDIATERISEVKDDPAKRRIYEQESSRPSD